uniref:Nuclear fragile X mental retardation-interacting protein 2 n=1 Tax=Geotrypetes seraphini TaxID=260995 RepID=A0A6P8P3E2_GEOSA|nr:nuclear fragile X mental retardation-interacting protein 2 [Geotrypetes seraphini]
MEEQQPGQAQHYCFYRSSPPSPQQHGAQSGSSTARAQPKPLKHEQPHGLQHQETHPKKAGYGSLNGNAGERENLLKNLGCDETTNLTSSSKIPNGSQQLLDTNSSPKQTVKVSTFGKVGNKAKSFIPKNSVDKRNDKSYESNLKDNRSTDRNETVSIVNGGVSTNSCYITNGYVSKAIDNDGSGSESGYTIPKKRKARRNSAKGCENLNLVPENIMQPEVNVPSLKQDSENFKTEYLAEQKGNRVDSLKVVWKYEAGPGGAGRGKAMTGDIQRKNSDAKPAINKKFDDRPKGKHAQATTSKEDSWTLFKPPPVFPVDNSSAKIVPKISYASKVKENLNKAAQNSPVSSSLSFTGDTTGQQPGRLAQVPMSAMKSVTSANFSNGPILAGSDGKVYPAGTQPLLTTCANTITATSVKAEGATQDPSTAATAVDQKKSSLFMYPSNMQSVLLGTTQVDLPCQTNQQSLGDIFQNQWGLSFINEPSAGPDTVVGKLVDSKMMEVTFQGGYAATLVSQGAEIIPSGTECPLFPKAYELDKRTSAQVLSGMIKPVSGSASEGSVLSLEPHHIGELQKSDASSQGALVFLSKDYEMETPRASPTNTLSSAKDQRFQGSLERNDSWGSFDQRAAVIYHTKEMEAIWNLQKQDPKRVITYDEAMDHPGH